MAQSLATLMAANPTSDLAVDEWKKYLPRGCEIVYSEYSGLYLVKELYNGNVRYYTLDRIAALAKHRKGVASAYGKHMRLTKKASERISNDLIKQAKKLENLAQAYKLIATALSMSVDNIEEIISIDPTIKKALDNPF